MKTTRPLRPRVPNVPLLVQSDYRDRLTDYLRSSIPIPTYGRQRRVLVQTYAILRRSAWRSPEELEEVAGRSTKAGDEMSDDIRWIRSYVLEEGGGSVGSVCIYQATSPDAIREHAGKAEMPADEIIPIADTVVVREDPKATA